MKGIGRIPGVRELLAAYGRIGRASSRPLRAETLVLWCQWTRFDPRLGELLAGHVARHWNSLNPLVLRGEALKHSWPATTGVVMDHAAMLLPAGQLSLFKKWVALATGDLPRGDGGLYFIGLHAPGGWMARIDAERASVLYTRWGWLAHGLMLGKAARLSGTATLVDSRRRRIILDELLENMPCRWIRLRDYLDALGGLVSRRQAELDLGAHPRLRPAGNTKARVYRIISKNTQGVSA